MRRTNKKSSTAKSGGQIRIVGGQWRGRKLPVADLPGLRPTGDRVKETLFNWLMHDVADARVLDCFAGSGGLGFEALSRYAKEVLMLEKSDIAARQLNVNKKSLQAEHLSIELTDSLNFLSRQGEPFDIVFIDPPFHQSLIEQTCQLLEQNNWLSEQAIIYIESEQQLVNVKTPDSWRITKEKQTGNVFARLFERDSF